MFSFLSRFNSNWALGVIALLLGLLIWNSNRLSKKFKGLTSQNRLLTALRNLDKVVLSTLDVKTLAQSLVDSVGHELGYMFGVIALVTQDGQGLKRVAISKTQNEQLEQLLKEVPTPFEQQVVPLSMPDNLLARAVREQKSFITNTVRDTQRGVVPPELSDKIQQVLKIKQIFIYPLVTKNKVIGAIYYASTPESGEVSEVEYTIMEEFSHQVARTLNNALLYQDISIDREVISAERNKMAVVLSGITDAVIAIDLNRNIIIFNKAAENLIGVSAPNVLGRRLDDVIKVFDNKRQLVSLEYCPIRTDFFEGVVYSKDLLRVVGVGNKETFVSLVAGQIREGRNVNLGCILTLHDITKERQLEEMKLDFVSMAAHELRTPLTSIKGYLYIYLKNYQTILNGDQKTLLTRINIATQRLVSLVENLLNVSRIERGVLTIQRDDVDWLENVKTIVSEIIDQAKDKKQELTLLEPTQNFPHIKVDKFRINEVLVNLLTNAINYTSEGGKIKVWIEEKDGNIITHIQDNGPGIPKEAVPHLFTKFFRVSGNLEQGSKGTGLGLYIARSIIEMHKGKIWVESEFGQGSTFSFSIPVASA